MAGFKTGAALGAAVIAIPAFLLLERVASEPARFPGKSVTVMDGYVSVIGSIVGDEPSEADRPVNNMVEMKCQESDMSCSFLIVNETEPGFIELPSTDTLAIRRWTERELVADSLLDSSPNGPCNYYEVRVLFDTEAVTYTRIPNPSSQREMCEELFGSDDTIRQWRIDDGKGWSGYTPGKS